MGEPISVNVTIDLDKVLARRTRGLAYYGDGEPYETEEVQETTIEDLVLDGVVAQLVKEITSDRDFHSGAKSRISNIRDEILRDLLTPILTAAIEAAVQPTNTMGEGVCEPVTLSDIILQRGKGWLEEHVDSRPGRGRTTRIQHIIAEAVDRSFTGELQQALSAGKAEIKRALTKHAAELLAETLAKQAEAQGG